MKTGAADLMKRGDPKFAEDTALLVASLANMPRKPAKRAPAKKPAAAAKAGARRKR